MSNLSTYLFVCNKKCSYVTLSFLQAIYSHVNLYALNVFLCYFVVFTSNLFTC